MRLAQIWNGNQAGITRRHAIAIVLVVFAHIGFWQLLRLQNAGLLHYENSPVVRYLQILTVQPKPAPPVKLETTPPVTITVKKTVNENTVGKRHAATVAPSDNSADVTPEAITVPNPQTVSDHEGKPALDLNALRGSALAMERKRKPTEIEQMQAGNSIKPTLEQRLGEGTKRAEKKDCLRAYSGIGLLAVIPLAVSTVVDTGCKW